MSTTDDFVPAVRVSDPRVAGLRLYRGASIESAGPAGAITIAAQQNDAASVVRAAQMVRETVPALRLVALEVVGPAGPTSDGIGALARLFGTLLHALQSLPAAPAAAVHDIGRPDARRLLFRYELSTVAEPAVRLAHELLQRALGREGDPAAALSGLAAQVDAFIGRAARLGLDQTTRLIRDRAIERGIPWARVSGHGRIVRLGHAHKAWSMFESSSDRTSQAGLLISRDKMVTADLMHQLGLPGVRHQLVDSPEQARRAARALGWPVVVKPNRGAKGIGVTANITSDDALVAAYERARAARRGEVLVEKHVDGDEHRLLVIGGRLVAAAIRLPAHVVGDGLHDVRTLVARANEDPRRGDGFARLMVYIEIEAEAMMLLRQQGLGPDAVPAAGQRVMLRTASNIASGGSAIDVTDRVHPDNRWMAETIARAVRLDTVGVDFLSPDIGQSWRSLPSAVCEINATPGFRPHLIGGTPASTIADALFALHLAPGDDGRIPSVAITGTSGKTTVSRLVDALLRAAGRCTGLACTDGVFIGGRALMRGDLAGGRGVRAVLAHPDVDAAVLETARGGLVRHGVPFDRCDVAAVLNVGFDHVGQDGVRSVNALARVKALITQAARHAVVLNARDAHCVAMARSVPSARLVWFSNTPADERAARHLAAGGRAAVRDAAGRLVWCHGTQQEIVGTLDAFPLAFGGAAAFNVENLLAAIAIGHAIGPVSGIDTALIRATLIGFVSDPHTNPGRLNVLRAGPAHLVLDVADSPPDMAALGRCVAALGAAGPRTLAFTCAGNRVDEHVIAMGRTAATHFDRFVVFNASELRGRGPDDVPALLARGLMAAGVGADRITIEPDGDRAMTCAARALASAGVLTVARWDQKSPEQIEAVLDLLGVPRDQCTTRSNANLPSR